MTLTPQQHADYRDQGFVVLPQLIEEAHVAELREIFDRLFSPPADGGKPLYYDLVGKDPDAEFDSSSIPQLLHPCHHVPELTESQAWQRSLDVAMALLDTGDYGREDLVVRDHAIVKPPGSTGATCWHQDEAYWNDDMEWRELSVWIALQDTTREMGCMEFVPGSHKGGIVGHHSMNNDPRIVAIEMDLENLDESKVRPCPLQAGGATVHDCRTMHYAGGNQSDEPRRAFILTVGTPPKKRETPQGFYWNEEKRRYLSELGEE